MQSVDKNIRTGFTGAYQDSVTFAYPLGNGYRWYVPGLMRFNAPDDFSPFGTGGVNTYVYCGADPVNYSDPSGHMQLGEFMAVEQTQEHRNAVLATNESEAIAAKQARRAAPGPFARRVRTARAMNDGRDNVIREDEAGSASSLIAYPGISSCLTVTGFSAQGMRGVHIPASSGTTTEHIDNMLAAMNARDQDAFLVAGAIKLFKEHVGSDEYNTRAKISNRLKAVAPNAEVNFFDTTTIAQETHVYIGKQREGGYRLHVLPSSNENRGPDNIVLGYANEATPIAQGRLGRINRDLGNRLLVKLRLLSSPWGEHALNGLG